MMLYVRTYDKFLHVCPIQEDLPGLELTSRPCNELDGVSGVNFQIFSIHFEFVCLFGSFFQLGESGEFFRECSNEGTPENISDVAKASQAPVEIVEYGAKKHIGKRSEKCCHKRN
jgi:hypothetical protein